MTGRLLVLAGVTAGAFAIVLVYTWFRARTGGELDRLDVSELGLELMAGCCAFVVFTTPSCRPCKAAMRVVSKAAEASAGLTEVTTVDALERSDLALAYDVRTVPTVFLITASGHVIRRWRHVPKLDDLRDALAAI